jgi:hypothetical protein
VETKLTQLRRLASRKAGHGGVAVSNAQEHESYLVCATRLHKADPVASETGQSNSKARVQAMPGSTASLRIGAALTIQNSIRYLFAICQGLNFSPFFY